MKWLDGVPRKSPAVYKLSKLNKSPKMKAKILAPIVSPKPKKPRVYESR